MSIEEEISEIFKAPLPTILVMSGVLFLFLSVVGKLGARIVVTPQRQKLAGGLGTLLLISGIALYGFSFYLNPNRESSQSQLPYTPTHVPTPLETPTPTASSTTALTHDFLVSKHWEFLHGEGDVISPQVKLQPNGTISGVDHPNESTWGVEDGILVFYHVSKAPSTRFTKVWYENGKTILSGQLLLVPEPEPDVTHVLKEL